MEASQGGEDDGSHKDDVAETEEAECPGSLHISAVDLFPGLGNTKEFDNQNTERDSWSINDQNNAECINSPH